MALKFVASTKEAHALVGALDEHAEPALDELQKRAEPSRPLRIDMSQVGPINSVGLGLWVRTFNSITAKTKVEIFKCSMPLLRYANLVGRNAPFGAVIQSLVVPFTCKSCRHGFETTMSRDEVIALDDAPSASCPKCRSAATAGNAGLDIETFAEGLGKSA